MIPHLCLCSLCFLQLCNKSLINQAWCESYWENISPCSFLYGPHCARSVLSRPRAEFFPIRPSGLVYCWRAVERQLTILYNSEIWPKSVGCKIVDLRSLLRFLYPGIPGCLCARGNIDHLSRPTPLENKDTINVVKYRCLYLLVKVFIKVMNGSF